MIAITVGVGRFAEMAQHAAAALTRMTGLSVRILDDAEYVRSGLAHPVYLRFRAFDACADEDVLYFDADLVCLRSWDPSAMRDPEAIVAVRDRMMPPVFQDAAAGGVPADGYFNAGLFIANRRRHRAWLEAAEAYVRQRPNLLFRDQSALNALRVSMGIPLWPLDRRYNWVCFGEGQLEYRMQVVMAHRLKPGNDALNMDYYAGHYAPPVVGDIAVGERAMRHWAGRQFTYIGPEAGAVQVTLQAGGTIFPPAEPGREGYWFVEDRGGRPVLTLASQTHALHEFYLGPDGGWRHESAARQLRPRTAAETASAAQVAAQRWFQYERVGHDRRRLELRADGQVGEGRGGCEQTWSLVVEPQDAGPCLILGGRGRPTCRLVPDASVKGTWRGRWLVHERMPIVLSPDPGPGPGADPPHPG
jgi:hypothetical protein